MKGIAKALIDHASSEGKQDAIRIGEDWQATLEAMIEVANTTERAFVSELLKSVNDGLKALYL